MKAGGAREKDADKATDGEGVSELREPVGGETS